MVPLLESMMLALEGGPSASTLYEIRGFGEPAGIIMTRHVPPNLGGITSPEKGVRKDTASLHSQTDSVTITHSDPNELKRILEIARVMGASVGPANAGGRN